MPSRSLHVPICVLILGLAGAPARAADDRPAPDARVTRVRVFPRAGHAEEMKGGKVLGSLTGPTNDFEEIVAIADAPAEGGWTDLVVPRDRVRAYRFVKYQARNGVAGDVAELEFFAGDRKLAGTPFATAGGGAPENDPRLAFDGDTATFFRGSGTFQQYVGLDLGPDAQAARPAISVPQGAYPGPQSVVLTSGTPGARIIYSIDGWNRPQLEGAGRPTGGTKEYDGAPVRFERSSILQAVAIKPGLADSTVAIAAYRIGEPSKTGAERAEFHIGNSLTDTVNPWMEPLAASGGHAIRYYRFTIPGAPTEWLWHHPGSGFGETNYAQAFVARAPLTDLITQPFAGHGRSVDNEADYSGRFFDLARKDSPGLQMWLYVQWPGASWDRDKWANGRAEDGGRPITLGPPAKTWGEAVANHVRYTERVREAMNRARADEIRSGRCKPVRIIPGGPALALLKEEMEAGKVPGMTDFVATVFPSPDDIHMTKPGAYLIALVHYACLFGEDPTGRVTHAGSGLNPEQARIFQRIAWQTVVRYTPVGPTPR